LVPFVKRFHDIREHCRVYTGYLAGENAYKMSGGNTPFPPEAPMATRSPGLKSWASVMVLCTSVSKTLKKQSLHICCPVFGRLRIAFAFWQRAQLFGAIVDGYHWLHVQGQVESSKNQIKVTVEMMVHTGRQAASGPERFILPLHTYLTGLLLPQLCLKSSGREGGDIKSPLLKTKPMRRMHRSTMCQTKARRVDHLGLSLGRTQARSSSIP
jgi:hypothetical protein